VNNDNQAARSPLAKPQKDPPPDSMVRPKYLEELLQESSGRRLSEMPGGARLAKKLGKVLFETWFAKATFVEERDQILVLQTDTRLAANRIEQQFDQDVLDAFQPEHKGAVRVRVLVRKGKTADSRDEV